MLLDFAQKQFGHLTLQEVEDAFDLYCAGKIGGEIKAYGNMNPQVFGRILSAYKDHRASQKMRENRGQPATYALPAHTDEQQKYSRPIEVIQKEAWERLQKFVQEGVIPVGWNWVEAFDYGFNNNLLDVPTNEWNRHKRQCDQIWNTVKKKATHKHGFDALVHQATTRLRSDKNTLNGYKAEWMKKWMRELGCVELWEQLEEKKTENQNNEM
jgi:hypothetical protein